MTPLMMADLSDDSWADNMEHPKDHFGHRVLDAVRDTGEIPTRLMRHTRYTPRKRSKVLDRAVFYQRLSKLIQFSYVAILVFCGFGPTTMAAMHGDPHYLMWTFALGMIPPLWLVENATFKRGDIGRHTVVANTDERVRLYNKERSTPRAIERGPIRRELGA